MLHKNHIRNLLGNYLFKTWSYNTYSNRKLVYFYKKICKHGISSLTIKKYRMSMKACQV